MEHLPLKQIADELNKSLKQVQAAVDLLEDGNTVPFIARYRKEVTGGLDEIELRAIEDGLERFKALETRRKTVVKSMEGQGVLTDALRRQIEQCTDLQQLEAIYLPFKPKRKTRATAARERGLQPLADTLAGQQSLGQSRSQLLEAFVDVDRDVPDAGAALSGALDIIAEQWADQPATRTWLTDQTRKFGRVTSKVKRGKKTVEGADRFDQYFDRRESVSRIPGHRVLAMLRGVEEGVLRVDVELEGDRERQDLKRKLVHNREFEFSRDLLDCADDCFDRLLMPAAASVVLSDLKQRADDEAISVFGKNLRELLMASPAGPRVTMGIDPGFRTGCKVAVVDGTGKFVANTTVYPTPPKEDVGQAEKALLELIRKHGVELIAIGNGTASRETDAFVAGLIRNHDLPVTKAVVSEAGASVYSASETAAAEFPDLDLTVRGAISIARRLQDPLAELVKTDPKSIGVGQYQHDVNQAKLRKCLDRTVESCVNQVGVDLNTASGSLLSHVAGIGPKLAGKIVDYRDQNGSFRNRSQLTKVPSLGKKAFQQAAGFLRIRGGTEPLDASAVHPESYLLVKKMADSLQVGVQQVVGDKSLADRICPDEFVDARFGLPTVRDIVSELGKPGRDPRAEFQSIEFDDSVSELEDLNPGMVLQGVVTNVTHFGAFVDIGVHQDGLIHVSQLADHFVADAAAEVSVGQPVTVEVLEIDSQRRRIGLKRKG